MGHKKGLIALHTEPSPQPIENQFLFRTVKILDIGYVAAIYFTIAYFLGGAINKGYENLYGTDFGSKTTTVLLLEVLSQIICIAIVTYIGRNFVEHIPSPLNGIGGFVHGKVKELTSGAFLNVFLVMFQYSMQDKLLYIKNFTRQQEVKEQNKKKKVQETRSQGSVQAQPIELEDPSQVNLDMTPNLGSGNFNYDWTQRH